MFIANGEGETEDEACVMQHAALAHARAHNYIDQLPLDQILTDRPCWANECLTNVAIVCNDRYPDTPEGNAERQRLAPLLERIVLAERRPEEVERRINARILCHQARKVLHLIPDEHREVCEAAIVTRERWLDGDATEDDCQEAAKAARAVVTEWAEWAAGAAWAGWAAGAAWAVVTAEAAWDAEAVWAGWAMWAAEAAEAAEADTDWVLWLDELLDVWEKACAAEGALHDSSEAERLVAEFTQAGGG